MDTETGTTIGDWPQAGQVISRHSHLAPLVSKLSTGYFKIGSHNMAASLSPGHGNFNGPVEEDGAGSSSLSRHFLPDRQTLFYCQLVSYGLAGITPDIVVLQSKNYESGNEYGMIII